MHHVTIIKVVEGDAFYSHTESIDSSTETLSCLELLPRNAGNFVTLIT